MECTGIHYGLPLCNMNFLRVKALIKSRESLLQIKGSELRWIRIRKEVVYVDKKKHLNEDDRKGVKDRKTGSREGKEERKGRKEGINTLKPK
jgi:hypothetical protein